MGAETLVVSPERVYGDVEAVPPSLSRSRRLRESESRFSLMLRLPARTHYPDNSPSFARALSLFSLLYSLLFFVAFASGSRSTNDPRLIRNWNYVLLACWWSEEESRSRSHCLI